MTAADSLVDRAREARGRIASIQARPAAPKRPKGARAAAKPLKGARAATERVRIAHRHAELAHRRAAELHATAARLFEKLGKLEQAARERAMVSRQLEGAESERDAQVR